MAMRQYPGQKGNQRKVIGTTPEPIGEKRVNFTTPPRYNKAQKTSAGYTKLFSEQPPNKSNTTAIENVSNLSPPHSSEPPLGVILNQAPLPLPRKRLPEKKNSPPRLEIRNSSPTPPEITSSPETSNISHLVAVLRGEVNRLHSEIEKIRKEQQKEITAQEKEIEFLRSQIITGNNERIAQKKDFMIHIQQYKDTQKDLFQQIRQKEDEIRVLLSKSTTDANASDENEDNLVNSQESLQALCRTQQVKKGGKQSLKTATNYDLSQKRLRLISEILESPDGDIEKIANLSSRPASEANSSQIHDLEGELEKLDKKLKACKRDKEFLEGQLARKEEEAKRFLQECKNLSLRIEELIKNKERLEKKLKESEKVHSRKFESVRSLAFELKEHIQSQQIEIASLKKDKKELTEKLIEYQNVSAQDVHESKRVTKSPSPSQSLQRSSPDRCFDEDILTNSPASKETKGNDYESSQEVLVPCSDEGTLSPQPPPNEEEDDSSPYESQTNQKKKEISSKDVVEHLPMNDEDDEEMLECQPILSVEQYAAQAYAATSDESQSPDNSPTQKMSVRKEQEVVVNDELDLSLSQEMDSILGMSQYRTNNISNAHLDKLYGFPSPISDLNADPSLREQTTKTALSKLESVSSQ